MTVLELFPPPCHPFVRLELREDADGPPMSALVRTDVPQARVVFASRRTGELYYVDVRFTAARPVIVASRIVRLPRGDRDLARWFDQEMVERSGGDGARSGQTEKFERVEVEGADAPLLLCSSRWPDGHWAILTMIPADESARRAAG